ncbi:biglycan isoform X2 [Choloepus didactylus]|uniref:biglycan isoform X2 n=1 Tax=Choloepus didactylus TaxID=27675 RepID=UPI0018A06651|nr:biglycan isoform X2 [Choloepus didactylus]
MEAPGGSGYPRPLLPPVVTHRSGLGGLGAPKSSPPGAPWAWNSHIHQSEGPRDVPGLHRPARPSPGNPELARLLPNELREHPSSGWSLGGQMAEEASAGLVSGGDLGCPWTCLKERGRGSPALGERGRLGVEWDFRSKARGPLGGRGEWPRRSLWGLACLMGEPPWPGPMMDFAGCLRGAGPGDAGRRQQGLASLGLGQTTPHPTRTCPGRLGTEEPFQGSRWAFQP